MEIGELVAVAVDVPHTEGGCPFCRPKEEVNETNTLRPNYDEDTEADNDTDNHSGTLATNLGSRPQAAVVPPIPKGEDAPVLDMQMASAPARDWHAFTYDAGVIPVLYGAHHLIPGNDALAKSTIYTNKWLGPVDDGPSPENIGYNVNSANNGIWLPGNYGVRPWKGIDPRFQQAYAFLAMHDSTRQFHDAHRPFSSFIRSELNNLEKLLKKMKNDGCPGCGAGAKKDEPQYHLNSRLNAVSKHCSKSLQGRPNKWKPPAYTSAWCELFSQFVAQEGGWEAAVKKLRKLRSSKTL